MAADEILFTEADFELYGSRFQSDSDWNGRRLEIRQRLQALGERVVAAYAANDTPLDRRESLHNPHATNRKRVRMQRTILFRSKADRAELQKFLGKDLAPDLKSARNNVHLQAGLDESGFFWGLRLDSGAWYDLGVLIKAAQSAEGAAALAAAGAAAPGFQLTLDGKGPRPLEGMGVDGWRLLPAGLTPGESRLDILARLPPSAAAGGGTDFVDGVVEDLARLGPLMALASWSLSGASPFG